MRKIATVVLAFLLCGCSSFTFNKTALKVARHEVTLLEAEKYELCGYLVEAHQNLNNHQVVYLGDGIFFDGVTMRTMYMDDLGERCRQHLKNVSEMQEGLRELAEWFAAKEGHIVE